MLSQGESQEKYTRFQGFFVLQKLNANPLSVMTRQRKAPQQAQAPLKGP